MTILVTGGSGQVGSILLKNLAQRPVTVHALTRDPSKAAFPDGITPITGDMLDVGSMRKALDGVSTLFLLNAVTPQELTQAMLTLNLAREAGIQRVVYLSVFNVEKFTDVPHFASKHCIERMIEQSSIPATILRPNCFMQNDALFFKNALMGPGVYPFPIGEKGVSMVDARDIAQIAADALVRREQSADPLPSEVINVVGPDALTGPSIAKIWSDLLSKPVQYAGSATSAFESQLAHHGPSWMAMDMRLMLDRFCSDGMSASSEDVAKMDVLLGRPARSYAEFAAETLVQWQSH